MLFEELQPSGETKKKKWRDLSTIQKGGIIVGGGLLAFTLYRGIQSIGGQSNVKKVPVNTDLLYYTTQGGQTMQWNPDNLAKEFETNFEGYNFSAYPETTDKLLALNDEQIKALYNHYNEYYANDEPTLTQLIDSEWVLSYGYNSYGEAVAKLKSLGLN